MIEVRKMKVQYQGQEFQLEFQKIENQKYIEEIKQLFREYAEGLPIALDFQDFEEELNKLPGKYGPPDGVLILAYLEEKEVGCIALRKISEEICEMKRLYVKREYRSLGIGRVLVKILIKEAKHLDYKFMRLDTIPSLKKAQNLYESFGFYDIEPYVYNPTEGARFMELDLNSIEIDNI